MKELRYFDLWEFDSPDMIGSGEAMNEDFLQMLDKCRDLAGLPFVINSGFRSKEHNASVGGKANSSHMKGLAADIAAPSSHYRYRIIEAAIKVGFNRIGIGKTFIHLDNDKDKPKEVAWLY